MEHQFDIAIIGGGTAGMSAYKAAIAHTPSVAVIEGESFGTTCAKVGCMPSKLLIAAADAAAAVRRAPAFGVRSDQLIVDGRAVMKRVRDERDRFVGFVLKSVDSWPAKHRFVSKARFIDPYTIGLDNGDTIVAKRFVIATGSSAVVLPDWKKELGDRLLISDDVFSWTDLPQSVAVVGAGIVGLEIAQALNRLGVRVRLLGKGGKVGPLTSPALQAETLKVFSTELPLSADAQKLTVSRKADKVLVNWIEHGSSKEESFDYLLACIGRKPNLSEINLSAAGLTLNDQGSVHSNAQTTQTQVPHIFLAGDVRADKPLLHEAADEGKIAGDNAGRYPDIRNQPRRVGLAVVFSSPQLAIAGQGFAELKQQGVMFATGSVSFEDQGRSRIAMQNQGALEVYADHHSGKFLGAEMVGAAAEHIAHLLAWSVQRGDTVNQMLEAPFYHPVIEESIRTALKEIRRALKPKRP
jgi:dihydrolipoamide dehydrogenase